MNLSRKHISGMTLIEILVVLVLIGVVLGIVGGNFIGKGEKAKADAAKIEIGQISQALDLFKLVILPEAGTPAAIAPAQIARRMAVEQQEEELDLEAREGRVANGDSDAGPTSGG